MDCKKRFWAKPARAANFTIYSFRIIKPLIIKNVPTDFRQFHIRRIACEVFEFLSIQINSTDPRKTEKSPRLFLTILQNIIGNNRTPLLRKRSRFFP